MSLNRWMAAAAATVLASCGGASTTTGGGTPAAPETVPASEAVAWKDMKRAARMEHMKHVVLPKMKAAFTAFDPGEFADFKCVVCHGAGVEDKSFKMPNPKLPPLPADEAGFKKLMADEPDAVKFMSETVVPQMAAMLGERPYDPATQKGFGCFRCHTVKR